MNGAPLRGLRVVSLADAALPSLAKSFVDLGADVFVPPAAGDSNRPLRDLLESRGKRVVPAAQIAELVADADALIVTSATDVQAIAADHPQLVIAVVTNLGLTGDRAHWVGSEAVYKALSGTLSRSGQPGRPPLLQPGEIFMRSAAQQIVWTILAAVYRSIVQRRGAAPCSTARSSIAARSASTPVTG